MSSGMQLPDKKTIKKIDAINGVKAPMSKRGLVKASNEQNVKYSHSVAAQATPHTHVKKTAQMGGGSGGGAGGISYGMPQFFSPLHTPQNWQIAQKHRQVYQWARHYYQNQPKVAAGIDFYANFTINGFKLQCKSKNVQIFYNKLVKDLHLEKICRMISHDYYLLGDVYPFKQISCKHCFPQNSMVLTKNGHVDIKNIGVGQFVLSKNKEFNKVVRKIQRLYTGDMVSIKSACKPQITMTAQHQHFIVKPIYTNCNRVKQCDWNDIKVVQAKDIERGDYIACPFGNFLPQTQSVVKYDGSKYRIKNKKTAKIHNIEITEQFAQLMGWYVAQGSTDSSRSFQFSLNSCDEIEVANWIQAMVLKYFKQQSSISSFWAKSVVQVIGHSTQLTGWLDDMCGHGSYDKKVPWFILNANKSIKRAFLKGYLQGDGMARADRNQYQISTVSKILANDICAILADDGKSCYIDYAPACIDGLGINRKDSYRVCWRINQKVVNGRGTHKQQNYIYHKVLQIKTTSAVDVAVYNLQVENDHTFVVNNIITHNCGGSGQLADGTQCNHPGGSINRIIILNPQWIQVFKSPFAQTPVISLIPDDNLRMMASHGNNNPLAKKLNPAFLKMIAAGQGIPLSQRCVSHLMFNEKHYGTYGTSMLKRLFMILSYKTKLMTANWIVAERLILPLRIIKVGTQTRPATDDDLADITSQLTQVANDPNLTLVTHHGVSYEWFGATGKIHSITQQMQLIGKEILDGLMINQALLNGEGPGWGSAQVGIQAMISRLDIWRRQLAHWIETEIFLPVAMMQGFIDEDRTQLMRKITKDDSYVEWMYPKVKWNPLNLRDDSPKRQLDMQLYDKKLISGQQLLKGFDYDYDQQIQQIRRQQVLVGAGGAIGGAGGGGAPPMGGDMGGGGGAMPGPDMGGGAGGPMGGPPAGSPAPMGGDMGGGAMGGAPPVGGAGPTAASIPAGFKVGKKGSGTDKKLQQQQQAASRTQNVRLTSLQQKTLNAMTSMNIPQQLFVQYKVQLPAEQRPFVIDFAYPQIGLGVECLHPDTIVLTNNGSKRANDINLQDKLIGKNGEFVSIVKKYSNPNRNNMLKVKAMGMSQMLMTQTHPVLSSKVKMVSQRRIQPMITRTRIVKSPSTSQFINCGDLNLGDYLLIPKNFSQKKINSVSLQKYNNRKIANNTHILPDRLNLTNQTGWLIGMYLAQGCSSGNNVTFSLHTSQTYYINRILSLMKSNFGLIGTVRQLKTSNCVNITFSSASLQKFLKQSFGHRAQNKHLCQWVLSANKQFVNGFIQGHRDGDGCADATRTRHLTCSQLLANDIQRMYFTVGKFASVCKYNRAGGKTLFKNGKTYNVKNLHQVSNYNGIKNKYKQDAQFFYVPITGIEQIEYNGTQTINFETKGEGDSNHTYIVGNIISHNCDGDKWHEDLQAKQRDQKRDQKLASVGWRILRFNQMAINQHMDKVQKVIYDNVIDAQKHHSKNKKKAQNGTSMNKFAQKLYSIDNETNQQCVSLKEFGSEKWIVNITPMPDGLGKYIDIGLAE